MENSIEEDMKILENMNDGYTFKDCDMCNNYNEKTKKIPTKVQRGEDLIRRAMFAFSHFS